ncbi:MAG: hypothetical protein KAY22_22710 [Rhizorhabdus sp.]|jgi:hypothetical protein|uniref:hypothetical protein n=1 Tax=Rhizorhabdus sp. TaxID=1968843 RepID=UPI001B4D85F5|nr:hypothetical protein [Rhizorhabdus sp.]MBP8235113.1 hypothetical protein [Rhizorhabdus sp.]
MSFIPIALRLAPAALAVASPVHAADEPLLPASLRAIEGCWTGEGRVMGKPVTMAIRASLAALDALMIVDAESRAVDDPTDRYAAHLTLGASTPDGEKADPVLTGYWADSFGGGYAATGKGAVSGEGFDIGYAYPDATFINRWRPQGQALRWDIVARAADGTEKPFAGYVVRKVICPAPAKAD